MPEEAEAEEEAAEEAAAAAAMEAETVAAAEEGVVMAAAAVAVRTEEARSERAGIVAVVRAVAERTGMVGLRAMDSGAAVAKAAEVKWEAVMVVVATAMAKLAAGPMETAVVEAAREVTGATQAAVAEVVG